MHRGITRPSYDNNPNDLNVVSWTVTATEGGCTRTTNWEWLIRKERRPHACSDRLLVTAEGAALYSVYTFLPARPRRLPVEQGASAVVRARAPHSTFRACLSPEGNRTSWKWLRCACDRAWWLGRNTDCVRGAAAQRARFTSRRAGSRWLLAASTWRAENCSDFDNAGLQPVRSASVGGTRAACCTMLTKSQICVCHEAANPEIHEQVILKASETRFHPSCWLCGFTFAAGIFHYVGGVGRTR